MTVGETQQQITRPDLELPQRLCVKYFQEISSVEMDLVSKFSETPFVSIIRG
jgi:hypothetical protein